jgi:putative ABC transport system substrate-binding protein
MRALRAARMLAAAVALCAGAAIAQGRDAPPRIAFVAAAHAPAVAERVAAFRDGLRALGYVEGRTIVVDYRYADERVDRLPAILAEVVKSQPRAIVSAGPAVTRVAQNATATIPIVMAFDTDPLANGAVASLSRPGGNVTGLSLQATDLAGKQLELMKQVVPKLARIGVIVNTHEPGNQESTRAARDAAARLGIAVDEFDVTKPEQIAPAFQEAAKRKVDALLVLSSPQVLFHRARFAELAATHRLPAIYPYSDLVDSGGLMMYGVALHDLFRRSATYVDRILKGARAGDLPVEQPTTFELVVNLPAAKRIGLVFAPALLARADRVVR